jgi:hypothetical protein
MTGSIANFREQASWLMRFLSEVHMFFKLFVVRLVLFILFPIAFVCFAASGAFEALYEFLSESEAYYENELRTPPENPIL